MSDSIELSGEDYHRLLAEAEQARELRTVIQRGLAKAVAATLDEALTGIRERHATLAKLTKFSLSSAYWRRLHMDIGVLLEVCDRQGLLLGTVSPSTVAGAAEHVQAKARADHAEAVIAGLRAWLKTSIDATRRKVAALQAKGCDAEAHELNQRIMAAVHVLEQLDELEQGVGK